jgi:cysteine desulfurase/selenocysteine lyase
VHEHEMELVRLTLDRMSRMPGLRVIGPRDLVDRGGAVSFTVAGIHPHDLGQVLDDRGVAVRVGHHCAWPLHRRFGIAATTRATFYLYNDESDVDALVEGTRKALEFFA